MGSNIPEGQPSADGPRVMGSYDWVDGRARFIIADISRDDAWVSVPIDRELWLSEWR